MLRLTVVLVRTLEPRFSPGPHGGLQMETGGCVELRHITFSRDNCSLTSQYTQHVINRVIYQPLSRRRRTT